MPLVKSGKITDDAFVHVADGAELPTGDGRLTALHRRMQLRHSESAGL